MVFCLLGLLVTAFGSRAVAGDNGANPAATYTPVAEGSTSTHRSVTDSEVAQLNIYVGGSLPVGTNLVAFQYLLDLTTFGNTTGYITPLLFEYKSVEAATVYTVVGIGRGFEVKLDSTPQTIPFDGIEGTKVPTSGNFTFGFITAIVNSRGVAVLTSQGVVAFDGTYADGGEGVGGAGTTKRLDMDSRARATSGCRFGNNVWSSQCRLYPGSTLSNLLRASNRSTRRTIVAE